MEKFEAGNFEPEGTESREARERKDHVARELAHMGTELGFDDTGRLKVGDVVNQFKLSEELGREAFGNWQDGAQARVELLNSDPAKKSQAAFGLLLYELIIRIEIGDEDGFYEGLEIAINHFHEGDYPNKVAFSETLRARLEALW